MCVNQCGMLTAIDKTIKFRSLVPMDTKKHEEHYRALDKIFRLYNHAGFVIKIIHCDGEYRSMMDKVKDDLNVDRISPMPRTMYPKQSGTTGLSKKESGPHTIAFRIRQYLGL